MSQAITISDELHALLYRIKATYGSQMTPSRFLDYLVFGLDDEVRQDIIEQIAQKASDDNTLGPEIASKIEDNLL